jgi:hypothetical protein
LQVQWSTAHSTNVSTRTTPGFSRIPSLDISELWGFYRLDLSSFFSFRFFFLFLALFHVYDHHGRLRTRYLKVMMEHDFAWFLSGYPTRSAEQHLGCLIFGIG